MTVRPIRLLGDPVLRTPAEEVVDFDAELRVLVRDLWETLDDQGGAGLAAPQLGVGLRVFVYRCDGSAGYLVNPTFEVIGEEVQDGLEGCLSIPGFSWNCRRYERVVARGSNVYGEPAQVTGTRLLARAVQHEVDHLDGVLFLDRLDEGTREQAMAEIQRADWYDGVMPVIKESPHIGPNAGEGR